MIDWVDKPERPRDEITCEWCSNDRGGAPGNENIMTDGTVLCDYCHVDWIEAGKLTWQQWLVRWLFWSWFPERWFWWCYGPVNVWLLGREYRREHEKWPSWRWNDYQEHCPHCGNENMTEQAYDDLARAQAMGTECETCRCVTGGSPAHYEYGGSWWVVEVTCFRCGHKYEQEDSSV